MSTPFVKISTDVNKAAETIHIIGKKKMPAGSVFTEAVGRLVSGGQGTDPDYGQGTTRDGRKNPGSRHPALISRAH